MEEIFEVIKPEVKNYLRMKLTIVHPELLNKLTESVIQKALSYAKGYSKGLSEYAQAPINEAEVKSLILDETFIQVLNEIEE